MLISSYSTKGSPHVHMLLWLKDAPQLIDGSPDVSVYQEICDFVDGMYTCSKNWDGSAHHDDISKSSEDTWKELLKSRQTHNHTSTCRSKRGGY